MTKRKIITAVIAVILILAAGAYKLYLQGEEAKILTGTVEATKADVTPRLGGYLRERTVKEGDSVTAGQIIARLDTRELEAQLAEDEASLAKAQAQLTDLIKGARRRNCERRQLKQNRHWQIIIRRIPTACVTKNCIRTAPLHASCLIRQ